MQANWDWGGTGIPVMSALSIVEAISTEIRASKRNCPCCDRDNSDQPSSRYSKPPWIIRTCRDCNFVYTDSAPAYEHLAGEMDWDTTWAAEDKRRKAAQKLTYRLDHLTRWRLRLGKPSAASFLHRYIGSGRVLDIGCGGGNASLASSFEPYGVEISTKLAKKADLLFRQHGGYAVNAPCIDGLHRFPEAYFDACMARSYLEHEAQPLAVLKGVFRVLRPDGILVIKVPNYATVNRLLMGPNWCGFRHPDHLNYFTPASLRRMAERAGFTTHFRWRERLPTDDNFWAVLKKASTGSA
jgi:SAM-dependent methyltransferase